VNVSAARPRYATNTLTLACPLHWSVGQGVSLDYDGAAPDLGACELGEMRPSMEGTDGE
jgi:hypothetical protein